MVNASSRHRNKHHSVRSTPLGLSVQDSDRNADVFVRVPPNKESVFRASVNRDTLPPSDILQVWLDASVNPVRGREQADEIRRPF